MYEPVVPSLQRISVYTYKNGYTHAHILDIVPLLSWLFLAGVSRTLAPSRIQPKRITRTRICKAIKNQNMVIMSWTMGRQCNYNH